MTPRALFVTALLLSTAAWAACQGDDDSDTDTDTFNDGLTRVYGDLFAAQEGICCGESSSENPIHIILFKRTDDCDIVNFPTKYEGYLDTGEGYEIIIEEGGCYDVWAEDATYWYCNDGVNPIVIGDGESFRYDIHLTCCCEWD